MQSHGHTEETLYITCSRGRSGDQGWFVLPLERTCLFWYLASNSLSISIYNSCRIYLILFTTKDLSIIFTKVIICVFICNDSEKDEGNRGPASFGRALQLPWPCFSMYCTSLWSSSGVQGPFLRPLILSSPHGDLPIPDLHRLRYTTLPLEFLWVIFTLHAWVEGWHACVPYLYTLLQVVCHLNH